MMWCLRTKTTIKDEIKPRTTSHKSEIIIKRSKVGETRRMPINFEADPNQVKLNSVKQLKSKRNKDDESRRMPTIPGLDHDQDKVMSANQTNLKS